MKVLLVEDDEPTRDMIIRVLKRLDPNIEIDVAGNGDDALTRYLTSLHDVVITENVHPGMGGIELIETIIERRPLQGSFSRPGTPAHTLKLSSKNTATFRSCRSRTLCYKFRTW